MPHYRLAMMSRDDDATVPARRMKMAGYTPDSAARMSFREVYDQTFVAATKLDATSASRLGEFEGRSSVKTWVTSILRRLVQKAA